MSDSPYVGPRPFESTESAIFFGRRNESFAIRDEWLADRVTVLYGPAGVGKTSLLNAGVIPLLREETDVTLIQPTRVSHALLTPPQYNGYVYSLLRGWAPVDPPPPGKTISEFLSDCPVTGGESGRLLAAIDQFEEIFAAPPSRGAEREELLDQLTAALREVSALNLLLIVRDDHFAAVSSYEGRLGVPFRFNRLEALSIKAAVDAIKGPLATTGRFFTPAAVDELISKIRTISYTDRLGHTSVVRSDLVDPLHLQTLCAELWSALSPDIQVVTSEILSGNDASQAMLNFYDNAIRAVAERNAPLLRSTSMEAEGRIRAWIQSTFITEIGTRGTAFRGLIATGDMPNAVADDLTENHILVTRTHMGGTWLQLGQDSMINVVLNSNSTWTADRTNPSLSGPSEQSAPQPGDFAAGAEAAFNEGDFARARRYASTAAEEYASRGDYRRQAQMLALRGHIALADGDMASADIDFHAAFVIFESMRDNASMASALTARARALGLQGDHENAITLYRNALQRRPADSEARTGLGFALLRANQPADAEAEFNQALDGRPNNGQALAGRGEARVELRMYRQALDDLDRALASGLAGTDEIDARSGRAVALAALGRTVEAHAEIQRALRAAPRRALTLHRSAWLEGDGRGTPPGHPSGSRSNAP